MLRAMCLAILSLVTTSAASAQTTIFLDDSLGTSSGTSTCSSNPPFTQVLACSQYGFGRNCPGSFSAAAVRFINVGPFTHAIGSHPPATDFMAIRFDLDAIRQSTGREPLQFLSQIGIDVPSGGNQGAIFSWFTPLSSASVTIPTVNFPAPSISLNLTAADSLTLRIERFGSFTGNHAAWGNPRITLGPDCPTPALVSTLPTDALSCPSATITLNADARYWGPFTYRWQVLDPNAPGDWANLANAPYSGSNGTAFTASGADTPALTLNGPWGSRRTFLIRCTVTNTCGTSTTRESTISVCPSNYNCDGTVDLFDYLDFVADFAANAPTADYNQDQVIDFFDYLDFVADFSAGC